MRSSKLAPSPTVGGGLLLSAGRDLLWFGHQQGKVMRVGGTIYFDDLRTYSADADTVGYQYRPDATVRDQLVATGASLPIAGGHSLGTITQSYLARHDLVENAYLEAVPFGIVTPPNMTVKLGSKDTINFSYLNKLFNPHADVVPFDRWQHAMKNSGQCLRKGSDMGVLHNKSVSFFIALAFMLAGCVPHAVYQVHREQVAGRDSFAAHDEVFRVDPQSYPVFSLRETRSAPRSNVGLSINPNFPGSENPPLLAKSLWKVTHAFNGRFLVYSEEYDRDSCYNRAGEDKRRIKNCAEGGRGPTSHVHIYFRPSGEAYGWQYIRNPRWHGLRSGEVSLFRIDDSGDWSGQPWFECVDRCDKLERMKQEEIEGGDPFGVRDGEEQGSEIE